MRLSLPGPGLHRLAENGNSRLIEASKEDKIDDVAQLRTDFQQLNDEARGIGQTASGAGHVSSSRLLDGMRCGVDAPGDICGVGSFQLYLVLKEGRNRQCVLRQKQSRTPAQGICPEDGLVPSEVSLGLGR